MIGTKILEATRFEEVGNFIHIGTVYSYPKYSSLPFMEKEYGLEAKTGIIEGQLLMDVKPMYKTF